MNPPLEDFKKTSKFENLDATNVQIYFTPPKNPSIPSIYLKHHHAKSVLDVLGGTAKKKTVFFGNFSQKGGGVTPFPKTFCVITIAIKTPLRHLKITQKSPKNFQLDQKKR